jgi:hypothetical protein
MQIASGMSRQASQREAICLVASRFFFAWSYFMYFCYIDESGTSAQPGNTSHFVLAGLAIPIEKWKDCENSITSIKSAYGLSSVEIHTGWLLRKYPEQNKINNFDKLDTSGRLAEINKYRYKELYRLQSGNPHLYRQTKKNYKHTFQYAHLTFKQRQEFIEKIAQEVGDWSFGCLFAECIDKTCWNAAKSHQTIDEQAFEQVVARFEQYLRRINNRNTANNRYGLLIHDNNQTIAKKHTELMKSFHKVGTLWTKIDNIIETPLFVDSELTSMVQLADLSAYAIRRYLENREEKLFRMIFKIADHKGKKVVGIRHFASKSCSCKICSAHNIP